MRCSCAEARFAYETLMNKCLPDLMPYSEALKKVIRKKGLDIVQQRIAEFDKERYLVTKGNYWQVA